MPLNSCTVSRRHGRITQKLEDDPVRKVWPDLRCYPPLLHGSSRFEFDDRRTRGFRALHRWECLTVQSEALRDLALLRPLCGPPTHRVAAVRRLCPSMTGRAFAKAASIAWMASSGNLSSVTKVSQVCQQLGGFFRLLSRTGGKFDPEKLFFHHHEDGERCR